MTTVAKDLPQISRHPHAAAECRGAPSADRDEWSAFMLCAQADPEAFFPDKGGSTRIPKAVCDSCLVSAQCLMNALDNDERFGIWGGLSERQRRQLKKKDKP